MRESCPRIWSFCEKTRLFFSCVVVVFGLLHSPHLVVASTPSTGCSTYSILPTAKGDNSFPSLNRRLRGDNCDFATNPWRMHPSVSWRAPQVSKFTSTSAFRSSKPRDIRSASSKLAFLHTLPRNGRTLSSRYCRVGSTTAMTVVQYPHCPSPSSSYSSSTSDSTSPTTPPDSISQQKHRSTTSATDGDFISERNGVLVNSSLSSSPMVLFGATNDDDENAFLPDDDSFEALQMRMQTFVQHYQPKISTHIPPLSLVIAIAGGGGHFLSTLSSTPGASNVLLQGNLLYDREAFRSYVRQHTVRDSMSTRSSSNTVSVNNGDSNGSTFQYASMQAARQASAAALRQASELLAAETTTLARRMRRSRLSTSNIPTTYYPESSLGSFSNRLLHRWSGATGIGCASVLQTTTSGAIPSQQSRAFVVISRQDGQRWELQVTLGNDRKRNRWQEDVFVAHCIVSCLEQIQPKEEANQAWMTCNGANDSPGNNTLRSNKHDTMSSTTTVVSGGGSNRSGMTSKGDVWEIQGPGESDRSTGPDPPSDPVHEGASRVLSRENAVVALLLRSGDDVEDEDCGDTAEIKFSLLTSVALPATSIIFPGSFNPIHIGHAQLAQTALARSDLDVVWFEIALTNADKPPLSIPDVKRRVQGFVDFFATHTQQFDFAWGILLTNAPLFRQKVELLHPLLVPETENHDMIDGAPFPTTSLLNMIIGTDTLIRLIDPKYYDNSHQAMIQALEKMPCRFIVGGRVVQGEKPSSFFASGQEQVQQLPPHLQTKFSILGEDAFRVDISSTEIRKRTEG